MNQSINFQIGQSSNDNIFVMTTSVSSN